MTATQPQATPSASAIADMVSSANLNVREQAFLAQDGMTVELPDRRKVLLRNLPWKRAAHFLGLWQKALSEGVAALTQTDQTDLPIAQELLATWPEEVGLEPGQVTPNEVFWLIRRFFTLRGWKDPVTSPMPSPPPPPPSGAPSP